MDGIEIQAIAILTNVVDRLVGRASDTAASLRRLMAQRTDAAFEAAARSFGRLNPDTRRQIAYESELAARRTIELKSELPGLLGVMNRQTGYRRPDVKRR